MVFLILANCVDVSTENICFFIETQVRTTWTRTIILDITNDSVFVCPTITLNGSSTEFFITMFSPECSSYRLNAATGFITSGVGNYTKDMKCTWIIDVTGNNVRGSGSDADLEVLGNPAFKNERESSKSTGSFAGSTTMESSHKNRTIRLRLSRFETECGWDHLYVFDGDSMFSKMIAAYSGTLVPELAGETVPDLVAQSGRL